MHSRAQAISVWFSLGVIVILTFFALFGDFIVPNSPIHGTLMDRLKPPLWAPGGTSKYPLGTDAVGRCILSRIISGTKYALGVSVISILISTAIGVTFGLMSGYFGGIADTIVMRLVDLLISFPMILLGLLAAITLGQSAFTLTSVLVVAQVARFARQVRGEALALREADFVAIAHVAGCSSTHIIIRHLLPNVMNTVLVLMTLQVGWAILVESSLSFLGAGIPPPAPAWGLMVADGRDYITRAWWVSLLPGIAIMVTILAFNTLGDWIRDKYDPRLRQL